MTTLDTIRKITIQATDTGVDQTTAKLNDLAAATKNVGQASTATATVTDTSASKQLSAQSAYDKLRTSIDTQYRSQQQLAKGQSVLTSALNQGVISVATHAQMMDLLNAKYGQASPLQQAFTNSLRGVETQMVALSAGMGPVGVLLAGFGPWGLAAAAGIGLITSAINYLVDEANRMGDVASQLRNVSEATGLSTDSLQKLELTGASLGLTNQQVTQSFSMFEVQLGSLRDGTGRLYTELMRVNPALVTQVASTRDATAAWNLLAQAYVQADQQQQALIAHAAAGGRQGVASAGNLLAATAASGGIQSLPAPASLLSAEQIDQWSKLREQIQATNQITKDLMASTWTSETLDRELKAAQYAERAAAAIKDMADQHSKMSWLESLFDSIARYGEGAGSYPTQPPVTHSAAKIDPAVIAAQSGGNPYDNTGTAGALSSSFIANQLKAQVTALGSAATASDKLREKTLELNAQLANNTITQDTYNKALSGARLDAAISSTNAYVSALGPLATVDDAVKQKTEQLAQAQQRGAGLTKEQIQGILITTQATSEWAAANNSAQAGVYDLATATAAAADQLKAWVAQDLLDPKNPQQMANAVDILAAKMRAVAQAAQDANPATRELLNLQFQGTAAAMSPAAAAAASTSHQIYGSDWQAHLSDAGPQMAAFNSQLQTSLSLADDFANTFGQALLQAKTPMDALNSSVTALESSLIQMVSKNLVNQALGPLLSSFAPSAGQPLNILPTLPNARGNIFSGGSVVPFALGGLLPDIVTQPTFFPMANGAGLVGEAGAEAVMPLRRDSSGRLGVSAGGVGGSTSGVVNNIYIENYTGAQATQTSQKNSTGGSDFRIVIRSQNAQDISSGYYDKSMAGRYGITPVGQQR